MLVAGLRIPLTTSLGPRPRLVIKTGTHVLRSHQVDFLPGVAARPGPQHESAAAVGTTAPQCGAQKCSHFLYSTLSLAPSLPHAPQTLIHSTIYHTSARGML